MKTITKTYNLYKYDELSEKAKGKAIDWFAYSGDYPDYNWYECAYEDAKSIGLEISSFEIDRCNIKGKFLESARECAQKIIDEHGEKCETRIDAEKFLKERDKLIDEAPKDDTGDFEDQDELDQKLDDLEEEFLKTILQDYLLLLRKEYEHITSREYIEETIVANEYEFLENGERA